MKLSHSKGFQDVYHNGGAGGGRIFDADDGAVRINGTTTATNNLLEINKDPSASAAGHGISITMGANATDEAIHAEGAVYITGSTAIGSLAPSVNILLNVNDTIPELAINFPLWGVRGSVKSEVTSSTNPNGIIYGGSFASFISGTNDQDWTLAPYSVVGVFGDAGANGTSGNVTGVAAIAAGDGFVADMTVTNMYGVYVHAQIYGTNNYGMWIEEPTGGTVNDSIHVVGGRSHFGGYVSIEDNPLTAGTAFNGLTVERQSGDITSLKYYGISSTQLGYSTLTHANQTITGVLGVGGLESSHTGSYTNAESGLTGGAFSVASLSTGGSVTNAAAIIARPGFSSGTTFTNVFGLKVTNLGIGTNRYGLWIDEQTGGTINEAIHAIGDVFIDGKLTVTGLIDPTGMVFDEQSSTPGGDPGAAKGTIYVRNDTTHNTLVFVDDANVPHDIGGDGVASGGSLDDAYDFGSAGGGRVITGDSGAVEINNANSDNNDVLVLTKTPGSAGQVGDALNITVGDGTFDHLGHGIGITMAAVASGNAIDITMSGTGLGINAAPNTDTGFVFGQMLVDSRVAGDFYTSHFAFPGTDDYALRQVVGGTTTLNTPDGTNLTFAIDNAPLVRMLGTAFDSFSDGAMALGRSFRRWKELWLGLEDTTTTLTGGSYLEAMTDALTGERVQNSPAFVQRANVWEDTIGETQEVDFATHVVGTTGTPVSGTWTLSSNINDAGYNTILEVTDGGNLSLGNANGPALLNIAAGPATPTMIPDRTQTTTGLTNIGGTSVGIVANGTLTMQVAPSAVFVNRDIDMQGNPIIDIGPDGVGNSTLDAGIGVHLQNGTAAVLNVSGDDGQQYSPMFVQEGQGFQTGADTSHDVKFGVQVAPIEGSGALPTGELRWFSEIDDAGFVEQMSLNSAGTLSLSNVVLNGATSGALTQSVPATIGTPYAVVWPDAQASGTQVLQNDGSGNLSWATAAGGGGNTLDQAYDEGGAGSGRQITASAGAVLITTAAANSDNVLELVKDSAQAGVGLHVFMGENTAATGNGIHVIMGATTTGNGLELQMTPGASGFIIDAMGTVEQKSRFGLLQVDSRVTDAAVLSHTAATATTDYALRAETVATYLNAPATVYIATGGTIRTVSSSSALYPFTTGAIGLGLSTRHWSVLHLKGEFVHYGSSSGAITHTSGTSPTNHTLTWPADNATGVLTNNGSGALSWAAASGGSLDDAYDVGSSITADAGAVTITQGSSDSTALLDLTTGLNSTGTAIVITRGGSASGLDISAGFNGGVAKSAFGYSMIGTLGTGLAISQTSNFNSTEFALTQNAASDTIINAGSSSTVNIAIGGVDLIEINTTGGAHMSPDGDGGTLLGRSTKRWGGTWVEEIDSEFDAIGATTVDADVGYLLHNNTAAAAGAQQYSPLHVLEGQGWKTNATAATQEVQWGTQVVPVQGTANPSSELTWFSNINDAGFAEVMHLTSGADLDILGFGNVGTLTVGRVRLDNRAGGVAYVSHSSKLDTSSYALKISAGGETTLNSGTGQDLNLAIDNQDVVVISATGVLIDEALTTSEQRSRGELNFTTSLTLDVNDSEMIFCDTADSSQTITLEEAPPAGTTYKIKNTSADFTVAIAKTGGDVLYGNDTWTVATNEGIEIAYQEADNTWYVVTRL